MTSSLRMRKAADSVARLSLIFSGLFLIVLLNLFIMQALKYNYYLGLSEKNRLRVIYLEGPRGRILDRNGVPLAENRLSFNCAVYPAEAKRTFSESVKILSGILGESPEEIEALYRRKKPGIFNTVLLAEDLSPPEAMAIEERLDVLPGFMVQTRPQRQYPLGEAAAHAVGFTGPMTEEEEEALENYGYRRADWIGRDGIEKSYESYLRGFSGGLQVEVNNRGRLIRPLGVQEPKVGRDVGLTIDARLQRVCQNLLKDQRGAILVMELQEGGILALNSSPTFDTNLFASSSGRKKVGRILIDSRAPMMNRAIQGRYPPGSIFKVITALAALDTQKMTAATQVECRGSLRVGKTTFPCWKESGHGPQALTEALAHSCNVFFYQSALLAGIDALAEKARAFTVDQLTGVDLPAEIKGFVPGKAWKRKQWNKPWYDGDTANVAIGQGDLQLTPIRALVMIAVIATEGEILKPHLVDKINGAKTAFRSAKHLASDPENVRAVRKGTNAVVNLESGTGRLARPARVRAAGKTGTAQSGQDKTHAWFVGYAPAEDPKVALTVFLEHGGRGGVAAAGVAKSVFDQLSEMGYL